MCIIDCLSTIVFILPLYLDDTKVIILILWRRTFQLEYWRTFQLVSTSRSRAGFTPPFGYVKGTLRWKKTPLHTWTKQRREFGNKRCGFSARVNAMITEFFMFLYHQAGYLQIKNLSNLWQTRMGKAMIPPDTHIAICLDIEIRR